MLNLFFETIPNRLAPSPVRTSFGPARIKNENQEISIYQPPVFAIFPAITLLGTAALLVLLVVFSADFLAGIFGPNLTGNIILTTFSTGLIGIVFTMNSMLNQTISKMYLSLFQNYVYFNASFGVLACASVSEVVATLNDDNCLDLVMNDISVRIELDSIEDDALKQTILHFFKL